MRKWCKQPGSMQKLCISPLFLPSSYPVQTEWVVPLGLDHGEGGPRRGGRVQPGGGLLFGPGSPLAAQLHLQVQGDGRGGAEAPLPA